MQNGIIRFFFISLLALLILLRHKQETNDKEKSAVLLLAGIAAFGAMLAVAGIIFRVQQFQWIGLLLTMLACFKWALPAKFHRDILLALFLLYWAHPLPSRIFGYLQMGMQKMSVNVSEWLLHMLNVRVWADGFVLRTGVNIYEVPEWCSGMRTATTMLLVTLGLCLLRRVKWFESIAIITAALVQALVLNVFRIAAMVIFAPRTKTDAGVDFLHDSTGIILTVGILLIGIEFMIWQRFKKRRVLYMKDLNPQKVAVLTGYPMIWKTAYQHRWMILLTLIAFIMTTSLIYKSRSYHRTEMYKAVVEELRDSGNLESAEKLGWIVQKRIPSDSTWKLVMVRLLMLRGKYEDAMAILDRLPPESDAESIEHIVLRAYSLMWLGQLEEAMIIVDTLPEYVRMEDARVAMVLAEMEFRANNPEKVAKYIPTAAKYGPNINRVRMLYPYLRTFRKWDAITQSDSKTNFKDPSHAFSALEAYMNLNKTPVVAQMTRDAIQNWPDDPRMLEPLFFMALKQIDVQWEDRFASHLTQCIGVTTNIDMLYKWFPKCFQLARPDLAWQIYRKIEEIDRDHPALLMSALRYGDNWFSFRKNRLGIKSLFSDEIVDIKPFFLLGRISSRWHSLCKTIPLGTELATDPNVAFRQKCIETVLREFQKREESKSLSTPMRYEYAYALDTSGYAEKARDLLSKISAENPGEKEKEQIILSEFYESRGDWQTVYEILRKYLDRDSIRNPPQLAPILRLCRAQAHLRFGLGAIHTAQEGVRLFPHLSTAVGSLINTLIEFDSAEEALQVLNRLNIEQEAELIKIEALALYRSERYTESQSICRQAMIPAIPMQGNSKQDIFLPPAEASVIWHLTSVPSEKSFRQHAEILRFNSTNTVSPYLRDMTQLWLKCYEQGGTEKYKSDDGPYNIQRWLNCGRDNIEKAIALNQLTLLLCRNGEFKKARNAAGNAVKLLPESPILWRILISLSGGDLDVINAARRSCPDDSEIWLAELVVKSQAGGKGSSSKWNCDLTPQAAQRFSPAAITRAADYLLRGDFEAEAIALASDLPVRARGLLPAYVLCIKCALTEGNHKQAIEATKLAINSSLLNRPMLYKQLIALKDFNKTEDMDADTINALRQLRKAEPDNSIWAQMLGYTRFQRGEWEIIDSVYEMTAAIETGATNKIPYLVSAESSRRFGNLERAIDILRKGLQIYPDDLAMINNLAYTLSFSKTNITEALALTPRLMELGSDNLNVLDTIATIYLRADKLDEATLVLTMAEAKSGKNTPLWFRVKCNQARIAFLRKDIATADDILKSILQNSRGIPEEYLLEANQLMAEMEAQKVLNVELPEE